MCSPLLCTASTGLRLHSLGVLVRPLHVTGRDLMIDEHLMVCVQNIDVLLSHLGLQIALIIIGSVLDDGLALKEGV